MKRIILICLLAPLFTSLAFACTPVYSSVSSSEMGSQKNMWMSVVLKNTFPGPDCSEHLLPVYDWGLVFLNTFYVPFFIVSPIFIIVVGLLFFLYKKNYNLKRIVLIGSSVIIFLCVPSIFLLLVIVAGLVFAIKQLVKALKNKPE